MNMQSHADTFRNAFKLPIIAARFEGRIAVAMAQSAQADADLLAKDSAHDHGQDNQKRNGLFTELQSRIYRAIEAKPQTTPEVAVEVGATIQAARGVMKSLHSRHLIAIVGTGYNLRKAKTAIWGLPGTQPIVEPGEGDLMSAESPQSVSPVSGAISGDFQ